nr:MAG TPA: hypothetical protein [Caudoviricetes sp.]
MEVLKSEEIDGTKIELLKVNNPEWIYMVEVDLEDDVFHQQQFKKDKLEDAKLFYEHKYLELMQFEN